MLKLRFAHFRLYGYFVTSVHNTHCSMLRIHISQAGRFWREIHISPALGDLARNQTHALAHCVHILHCVHTVRCYLSTSSLAFSPLSTSLSALVSSRRSLISNCFITALISILSICLNPPSAPSFLPYQTTPTLLSSNACETSMSGLWRRSTFSEQTHALVISVSGSRGSVVDLDVLARRQLSGLSTSPTPAASASTSLSPAT